MYNRLHANFHSHSFKYVAQIKRYFLFNTLKHSNFYRILLAQQNWTRLFFTFIYIKERKNEDIHTLAREILRKKMKNHIKIVWEGKTLCLIVSFFPLTRANNLTLQQNLLKSLLRLVFAQIFFSLFFYLATQLLFECRRKIRKIWEHWRFVATSTRFFECECELFRLFWTTTTVHDTNLFFLILIIHYRENVYISIRYIFWWKTNFTFFYSFLFDLWKW